MRTKVIHFDPDSAGRRQALAMLERLRAEAGGDPKLIEALELLLEAAAAGRTVRVPEETTSYTPAQAGRLLGVSRQFVDKLIARGELPATRKPGSRHRVITSDDIEALRTERDRRRRGVDSMIDALLDGDAEH